MSGPAREDNGRKGERLGLRASESQRELLRAASQAEGTTVSDFVLRHATRAAKDVLADRHVFVAATETWDRLSATRISPVTNTVVAALDRPAQDVPGLEQLMNTPTVLDEV